MPARHAQTIYCMLHGWLEDSQSLRVLALLLICTGLYVIMPAPACLRCQRLRVLSLLWSGSAALRVVCGWLHATRPVQVVRMERLSRRRVKFACLPVHARRKRSSVTSSVCSRLQPACGRLIPAPLATPRVVVPAPESLGGGPSIRLPFHPAIL